MLGDGWPADVKAIRDLAGLQLAIGEHFDDLPPRPIRQCREFQHQLIIKPILK